LLRKACEQGRGKREKKEGKGRKILRSFFVRRGGGIIKIFEGGGGGGKRSPAVDDPIKQHPQFSKIP